MLARVLAGAGRDLGGQKVHDWAVLVRRPDGAVPPQEARARALFATEAERAIEQTRRKPLEPDRHFGQLATELPDDAIDHAAADQRLTDGGVLRPIGAVQEEIANRHGQEVIWIHQPG